MPKIDVMQREIDALAKNWDVSGRYAVMYKGELVMDSVYGFADRESGRRLEKNDTYGLSLTSPFFLGIATMQLCDAGKLSLDDLVSKYIPEYKHADRFTVRDLFMMRSGIPDHFYGAVMTALDKDPQHAALTREEKCAKEAQLLGAGYEFEEILRLIGDMPLSIEPGSGAVDFSDTNYSFVAEIIARISGMTLFDYMKASIFDPCGMTGVRYGVMPSTVTTCTIRDTQKVYVPNVPAKDAIALDFSDVTRLVHAIREKKLMSKKAWKTALTFEECDEEMRGIGFEGLNGYIASYNEGPFGNSIALSIDEKQDVCFYSVLSENPGSRIVDGDWTSFRPLARQEIEGAFQVLTKPKLERITLKNLFAAMDLRLTEQQKSFVSSAKDSICYCYGDRKLVPYLLTDGGRAIGLIAIKADAKKNDYNVGILQIDRRYQGCGYGRYALVWGINKLIEKGARTLEIGVNRENTVARRLYESVGFVPTEVYDGGVRLKKEVKENEQA